MPKADKPSGRRLVSMASLAVKRHCTFLIGRVDELIGVEEPSDELFPIEEALEDLVAAHDRGRGRSRPRERG